MKKVLFGFMLLVAGYVFWDLFVRDNPPMRDIEGENFARMVKGAFELIIGVVCAFIAVAYTEEA